MGSRLALTPPRKLALMCLAVALCLFTPAGTLCWWNGWLFLLAVAGIGAATLRLFARSPALAEERRTAGRKAKGWDRILVPLVGGVLPVVAILVAGLDRRWGRTAEGTLVPLVALGALGAASALTYWAMQSNPFFSSHVRIQADRGHAVVRRGPYRFLRHPGYAGAIVYNLAAPLVLGSPAALRVGVLIAVLLVVRTALEDATLRRELEGYEGYAGAVRYRLLPLVW
jgi:protein-S-isoprenylcysteine O-methyltransferase Ste14